MYVTCIYDIRIDLEVKTQIYYKVEDFDQRKKIEKFSGSRNGIAILRNV
jgi:hypothetical protein